MAKLVILKSVMDAYYDNMIEKSTTHKYIRRVPKSTGKGYNYFYPEDFKKPMKALLSFFGMKEDALDKAYTNNNINQAYGVTKQGFAQHVLEYLTNRKTWNNFFANKANREKYKVPEKPVKETETVKVSEKVVEGGKTKEKITIEEKETQEKNFKSTWNRSLMRKIYSMYNTVPEDKTENKPGINSVKIGDKVSYNGRVGEVVKDFENGMMFVKFGNGGMGRFAVKDLQKMDVTADEVAETTELNAAEQNVNGTNEAVQEEIKETENFSKEDLLSAYNLIVGKNNTKNLDEIITEIKTALDVVPNSKPIKARLAVAQKLKELGDTREAYIAVENAINNNTFDSLGNEHENRSNAMLGNQNAKKDLVETDEKTADEVANMEKDKAEFNELVTRLNELNKEFSANGGYSNRRTTREEDEKRRAAQKGIREIESKLVDFRNRIAEQNKGTFEIPSVYHDAINEWIRRKVKGQTISSEWLRKKFGGYYSDVLSFGDGYSLSLGDTGEISNPSVRINYEDQFKNPGYVVVEIGDMDKEQYRPRYMPQDDKTFTEVWNKVNVLREQLNNASGSTIAEKFFNTVMGMSNAYNENSDTSNIPRYRFTKDGIKDKTGKLEKIDATIREDSQGNEYIRLYADNYGASIPSIFYPENNTDIQTDYFEKDSCDVKPDHPYYDHLKLMALKRELYRGRATKWANLSKEEQKNIEEKIKDLEKQLKEPTEEELKAYRERRDVEEENKEIWERAKRRVFEKKQEEKRKKEEQERRNKFGELLNKFAEALEKEPPVYLAGLSKNDKIRTLEHRINKLNLEIANLSDTETVETKKTFREQLKQKLEEVKNEPDTPESEIEAHNNRSEAMMGNDNAAGFHIVQPEITEPKTDYKNLSRENAVNEYKKLGKEISKIEKENIALYEKNSGFGGGLSEKDLAPDSDYRKWLNGGTRLKELRGEVSRLTSERVTKDLPSDERNELLTLHDAAYNGNMGDAEETTITETTEETKNDELETPIPTIDANVAARINDISMSGRSGEVYQHDVKVEMDEFKDKFNYDKMNPQQKEYFRERLNAYAGLVGSSYNEMASKRLAAGPSWIVAGPAKYNTKRFNQKMDAERRAYETFTEKKDKFIKNTEKRLKELKYTGGTDSVEDVKKKVFEDYSNGKWGYGDKIDNTDPYAVEKVSGKIKFLEDAHDVTLLYRKLCAKNGITTSSWADRTDEEKAKRKEVLTQAINEAKEKGYSNSVIKEGIEHPFGQNQTAEIRRNKQRLEELQKRQTVLEEKKKNETSGSTVNTGRVDFDGGYIFENPEMDRIQIIYDGKPERDVIDKLKHNGFRWSPSQGAWQRQLNRNGRSAVNRVMEETGINTKIDIDGAGEVKKSMPLFIFKNGRFLIRK
jgi:hypothetical protein